jgi:peptidyl-prolyl cis-trans isomerase A (cyclophilin A)
LARVASPALTPSQTPTANTPTATNPPRVAVLRLTVPTLAPPPRSGRVPAACKDGRVANELTATLHTSAGDIVLLLFPDHAPVTVQNFVGLAEGSKEWTDPRTKQKSTAPLYDGTIFHRVIDGFMIQGGDPLGKGFGGPGYEFKDEFHPELKFDRPYLLAMANAGPGTNGSQFFITVGPTPHLNRKHTIFGEVADADSRAVVDRIAKAPTGGQDRPRQDVTIDSVTIALD